MGPAHPQNLLFFTGILQWQHMKAKSDDDELLCCFAVDVVKSIMFTSE
jgi:hypothetical protein